MEGNDGNCIVGRSTLSEGKSGRGGPAYWSRGCAIIMLEGIPKNVVEGLAATCTV